LSIFCTTISAQTNPFTTIISSHHMNKKLIFSGLIALAAGFVTLTAFGPKQDAQKAEISAAVTAKLEEYKAELQAACDERVAMEAKKRFDEQMATIQLPATNDMAAAPKKKVSAKGPNVKPLPKTSAPADPQKQRAGSTPESGVTPEQQKSRSGATPPAESKPVDVKEQKKRGGATPSGGGN
jgi:hypothetical protein